MATEAAQQEVFYTVWAWAAMECCSIPEEEKKKKHTGQRWKVGHVIMSANGTSPSQTSAAFCFILWSEDIFYSVFVIHLKVSSCSHYQRVDDYNSYQCLPAWHNVGLLDPTGKSEQISNKFWLLDL